jgi:hypothetical protein
LLEHVGTDLGKRQAELLIPRPTNRGSFDNEGIAFIFRKDTDLQLDSGGDDDGTCDSAAARRQVKKLPIPSHDRTLLGKVAAKLHEDANVLAVFHDAISRRVDALAACSGTIQGPDPQSLSYLANRKRRAES